MNCLTARETLDLIRPVDLIRPDETGRPNQTQLYDTDGNELPEATADEAAQHVKSCPACQTAVRRREKIDERIGQLSRDVPLPEGLRERLLARLSKEGTSESRAAEPQAGGFPAASKPTRRSRRWLLVSTVACIAVISGVGIWGLWPSPPASMSMDEIAGYALSVNPAAGLPELAQFKGGLDVQFPKTIRKEARHLMQPFRRLVDSQLGDREIAISFFTLSDGKRGEFAGLLVVVPAAAVKDVPTASSFPVQTLYRGVFCTTAWTEGKFVYLCCVHGGSRELHLLRPRSEAA
jgi:hypothetical protein